jgi:CubicO group peptidase (beta-lactamase class C family)
MAAAMRANVYVALPQHRTGYVPTASCVARRRSRRSARCTLRGRTGRHTAPATGGTAMGSGRAPCAGSGAPALPAGATASAAPFALGRALTAPFPSALTADPARIRVPGTDAMPKTMARTSPSRTVVPGREALLYVRGGDFEAPDNAQPGPAHAAAPPEQDLGARACAVAPRSGSRGPRTDGRASRRPSSSTAGWRADRARRVGLGTITARGGRRRPTAPEMMMRGPLLLLLLTIAAPAVAAPRAWPTAGWPRTSPAAVGLAAEPLAALDADFAAGKIPLVDSFLVARCGAVAFERRYGHDYATIYRKEAHERGPLNAHLTGPYNYFDPAWHPYYHGTELHTMQSVSKSVTSAVIGVAMLRGDFKASLDTPVLHWFDARKVENVDARKQRMTLRHVLTMTTGLDWNEDVPYADPRNGSSLMEARRDWVQFAIDQPMAHEPGATFAYNSGATELLAHIFKQETGQDIERYARAQLFAPLGIRHYHWKRTPLGVVDTEGGLYLSSEDLAKIGYLYLRRGAWDGRQLLAAQWIEDSVAPHVDVGGGFKYGYQWWLAAYGPAPRYAWAGRGFGGQYLWVFPDDDLVVVVTAWRTLDTTPYTFPVLERVRQAVGEFRCGSAAR